MKNIVYYGTMVKEFIWQDADATKEFGRQLGERLKGGECIILIGDLGAGKTTLTQGIAQGMGVTDMVQSPSYGIEVQYEAARDLRLHHFDFYRLDDPELLRYEFQDSLNDSTVVTIVEWADRLGEYPIQVPTLTITLSYLPQGDGRKARCVSKELESFFD